VRDHPDRFLRDRRSIPTRRRLHQRSGLAEHDAERILDTNASRILGLEPA
jgi:hypothetical protein